MLFTLASCPSLSNVHMSRVPHYWRLRSRGGAERPGGGQPEADPGERGAGGRRHPALPRHQGPHSIHLSMVHTVHSSVELTELEAGFLYCYLLSAGGGTVVNCWFVPWDYSALLGPLLSRLGHQLVSHHIKYVENMIIKDIDRYIITGCFYQLSPINRL